LAAIASIGRASSSLLRGIGPGAAVLEGTIDSTDIYCALRTGLFP
jgi:hypothetical protein